MTLGLDLSGAAARAVIVSAHGDVLARGERDRANGDPLAAGLAAVRQAVERLGGPVARAAVAVTHPGDHVAPDLQAALRDVVPGLQPLAVVSAGTAAVVAERWCGAARGLDTVVLLSSGAHVTGGVILEGRPWTGSSGLAGAFGWLALNPVDREDYRRLGGLEAEISDQGILRRAIWRIKSGDASSVTRRHGADLARITPADVFAEARRGDDLCTSVMHDTAKYVGMALSNLAAMLDPQLMILGGQLAASGDDFLERVRAECGRRLPHALAERLRIALSTLGDDAAAIGAAHLADTAR